MKKLIMKILGLDTFVCTVDLSVELLRKENEELKKSLKDLNEEVEALEIRLTEKLDEMESPDLDEYVREDDINDRIETYINDNDIVSQSYVDDEIESKVSDAVESAIEDLDIDEKVRDLFNDASPAPMSEQEIKDEIIRSLRAMFLDELEVKIKLK